MKQFLIADTILEDSLFCRRLPWKVLFKTKSGHVQNSGLFRTLGVLVGWILGYQYPLSEWILRIFSFFIMWVPRESKPLETKTVTQTTYHFPQRFPQTRNRFLIQRQLFSGKEEQRGPTTSGVVFIDIIRRRNNVGPLSGGRTINLRPKYESTREIAIRNSICCGRLCFAPYVGTSLITTDIDNATEIDRHNCATAPLFSLGSSIPQSSPRNTPSPLVKSSLSIKSFSLFQ